MKRRRNLIFAIVMTLVAVVLILLPTGFKSSAYNNSETARAQILETNDSLIKQFGIIRQGVQTVTAEVISGRFKGQTYEATNQIMGKLELDKVFKPGDKVLMVLDLSEDKQSVLYATALDYYRLSTEAVLFVLFIAILVLFAGWTGVKSLLSFAVSVLTIWKILIPGFLHGNIPPLPLALATVMFLTGMIIFLVVGISRRGVTAVMGAAAGCGVTFILALVFGKLFHVHGAVKPFIETLLYSGHAHIDITGIFLASIVIASSGAIMDIAVDIASAMQEIKEKAPEVTPAELIRSGFVIGRAVIGTMTTTLLLAYSGGYMSLIMYFMAQGIPFAQMLNMTYVSAEILATMAGSFGLVAVAPLTAVIGGFIIGKKD